MGPVSSGKVTAEHLRRNAYLYVRQSTLRQVMENTESTKCQYALRQRAVALGWAQEQVVVIDSDQGHSGASAADREGFQRLVPEVGMGRAGIVLGLEVSRLARNNADWHRLLEICALAGTLILDEDGPVRSRGVQRPPVARLEGHHERGRAARAPGQTARWHRVQSPSRRAPLPAASWTCVRPLEPSRARPRPAGATGHPVAVLDVPANRVRPGHREGLQRRGPGLPPPSPDRTSQGRAAVGIAVPLADPVEPSDLGHTSAL